MSDRLAEIKGLLAGIYCEDPLDPPVRYKAEKLDRVKAVQALNWLVSEVEKERLAFKLLTGCTGIYEDERERLRIELEPWRRDMRTGMMP